jgi:uncharacterized protein
MIIIIHSSKTMRSPARPDGTAYRAPLLIQKAAELANFLKRLSSPELIQGMKVSPALAGNTKVLIDNWTDEPASQSLAIDSFAGDIYSGLQAAELSAADRQYADTTLRILSGLYGIIRPYDSIMPYRLEMGYRLPDDRYRNLYTFWDDAIASTLPGKGLIINLAAVEYAKTITSFVDVGRIITPKFLTISPATGEPVFVVVHAKIARGAFANWLIRQRVTETGQLLAYTELGYRYWPELSTPAEPVFVCKQFGGLGLSIRLQK